MSEPAPTGDEPSEPPIVDLARLLLDRWRWFDGRLRDELGSTVGVELSTTQVGLLTALPADGARQIDLARDLGVSRQAVNELVKGLTALGLVETVPDPKSGRSRLVRPTDPGRAATDAARTALGALEQRLADRLGADRFDGLVAGLAAAWSDDPA